MHTVSVIKRSNKIELLFRVNQQFTYQVGIQLIVVLHQYRRQIYNNVKSTFLKLQEVEKHAHLTIGSFDCSLSTLTYLCSIFSMFFFSKSSVIRLELI